MKKLTCPFCESSDIRFMVSLTVAAPIDYYHDLSKKNIARKEVEIWGASWPISDIYCRSCGKDFLLPTERLPFLSFQYALQRIANGEANNPILCAQKVLDEVNDYLEEYLKKLVEREDHV